MPSRSRIEPVELLVLDLDGTLVQLQVGWAELRGELARIAREGGLAATGPGIRALMEGAALPGFEPVRQEMDAVLTAAEVRGAEHPPRNQALLDWIDSAGLPRRFSILSLNSHRAVDLALRTAGLADRIDCVVGREDVQRGKPDPEGLLKLIDGRAAAPQTTLLVGDHDGDQECARRAGARYVDVAEVGVRWVS